MTRIAPILALALAAACAPAPEPAASPNAASPGAVGPRDTRPSNPLPRSMAADSGVLAIQQTGRDVFTERYTRTSDHVRSVLTAPGLNVNVELHLGPGATVRRMDVRQFSQVNNAPQGTVTVEFRGDSVIGEATSPNAAPQVIRQAIPAGSIPFVNPSPVLMEQIIRRARAIGGSPVQVPIWLVAGGGQSAMSTVTFVEDGATFTLGPVEVSVTLDEQGRVTGGNIPQQGLTLARREATAEPADSAAAHQHH